MWALQAHILAQLNVHCTVEHKNYDEKHNTDDVVYNNNNDDDSGQIFIKDRGGQKNGIDFLLLRADESLGSGDQAKVASLFFESSFHC